EAHRARIQAVYDLPDSDLWQYATQLIGSRLEPLDSFLHTLAPSDLAKALRACLLLWTVTNGEKVPRQMQLESVIPVCSRRDSLVNAGTGSGKTICMVLAILLQIGATCLVINPLRRLQINQVAEFAAYGIRAQCINEDTPDDPTLWKKIEDGAFSAIIIAPESLDRFQGHMPRFARLLKGPSSRFFVRRIRTVFVDEAHFIHSAGIPLYGLPAHRPAWGTIANLRIHLTKGTPFQALSGTLPPHIRSLVADNLLFRSDYTTITFTSNRANITYVMRKISGSFGDFRNLDFAVPAKGKTVIFFDSKIDATNTATYLDSHQNVPEHLRGHQTYAAVYHGELSTEYLEKTYADFSNPTGKIQILCATSGCATGIDISNVLVVAQYGFCRDIPNWRQRGGRGGRDASIHAIFITLYEPWAVDIDISGAKVDPSDPDKPLHQLGKHPSKQQRAGLAMLDLTQSSQCIRLFLANYFDDNTPSRVLFTVPWCCDRHADSLIDYSTWFS
ncbi:P-loop containing nucleoside triphosphate hydrolase protein, partial [Auriscalpium vulgare]